MFGILSSILIFLVNQEDDQEKFLDEAATIVR